MSASKRYDTGVIAKRSRIVAYAIFDRHEDDAEVGRIAYVKTDLRVAWKAAIAAADVLNANLK